MNIATAKEQIKDTVEAYLVKDDDGLHRLPPSQQRPIFLIGAPGIGKTAIMEQVARELGIGIVSYSMTHHTRQSALGLPLIVHAEFEGFEYEASEYTMSEIVSSIYDYMTRTGLRQGILFLDEINCVSETLYPSMLQFLQFKTFGRHAMPADWVIVCAGNPPEYNRSVHMFDIVTLDRMREIRVEPEYDAWRRYASEKGLHPAVTTFLEAKRDCFYSVESLPGGEKSFVTARGWEDLADVISLYEDMGKGCDRELFGQFLHDEAIADKFSVYYGLFQKYRADYQIGSILSGEAGIAIRKRAQKAEFDERVALLGLVIDALGAACAAVLDKEALVIGLRDDLRAAKPVLLAGGTVEETLDARVEERSAALARRIEARTAGAADIRREKRAIDALRHIASECEMGGKAGGEEAFALASDLYRAEVAEIDGLVEIASSSMDNAFDFLDKVFGSGREMLVFLAELTTRASTTQFIAHYGNDRYYAHNSELKVDEARRSLAERIAELGLGDEDDADGSGANSATARFEMAPREAAAAVPTAETAGEPGAPAHDELVAFYDGKQFEYGFASICRMVLPGDLKGKVVLDACCRRGKGAYKLGSRVGDDGRVIAFDWSFDHIAEAKRGAERAWRDSGLHGNNIEFLVAYPEDLLSAGVGSGTVDVVYVNNVATLFCDPSAAFSEFNRVLKPDGLLVLETVVSSKRRDDDVIDAARAIGNSIQAARTRDELVAMLQEDGYEGIEVLEERSVRPDEGFRRDFVVPTVDDDSGAAFAAILVHARKPQARRSGFAF